MRIERVAVTYGELRSTGYPAFSNKRHEITLQALLQPGDTARSVKTRLRDLARRDVAIAFGDATEQDLDDLDIPF